MWTSIACIASVDKSSFVGIVVFVVDFRNAGTSLRLLSAFHTIDLGWLGAITDEDNAYIASNLLWREGYKWGGGREWEESGAPLLKSDAPLTNIFQTPSFKFQ